MDPSPRRAWTAPTRPDPGPTSARPLASASTRTLRLLTGYLACRDTGALVAGGLVAPAAARAPLCQRSFAALARVLESPAARTTLDALLARRLGARAEALRSLALCDLAARFLRLTPGSDPHELHALLWAVARQPGTPGRRLEERLAARIAAQGRPADD